MAKKVFRSPESRQRRGRRLPVKPVPPVSLAGYSALVVDASAWIRTNLSQVLRELGVPGARISFASDFETAGALVEKSGFTLVISELSLGRRTAFDLLNAFRATPSGRGGIFIALVGEPDRATLAQLAESSVDSFVLKPFTIASIRSAILETRRITDEKGQLGGELGALQTALAEGDLDTALDIVVALDVMDPSRALGLLFGRQRPPPGQRSASAAAQSTEKRTAFFRAYYRLLVNLYEALDENGRRTDAYEVVRRITPFFPTNPSRLPEVLHLMARNGAWSDLDEYFACFTEIEKRPSRLIRTMCAALYLAGRFELSRGARARGIEHFQRAARLLPLVRAWDPMRLAGCLKHLVVALLGTGGTDEAYQLLRRFPPELQSGDLYLALDFMVLDRRATTPEVIRQGRYLLQQGLRDPTVYEILIKRYRDAGSERSVEALVYEAIGCFPRLRGAFLRLLGSKNGPPQARSA